jgi:hypothetical protein
MGIRPANKRDKTSSMEKVNMRDKKGEIAFEGSELHTYIKNHNIQASDGSEKVTCHLEQG